MLSLSMQRNVPSARIISIEPFPDRSERLKETIRANGLENRVVVANLAITGESGSVSMDRSEGVLSQYRSVLTAVPKTILARSWWWNRIAAKLTANCITERLEIVDNDRCLGHDLCLFGCISELLKCSPNNSGGIKTCRSLTWFHR